jgi:hypothetical protein
LIEPDAVCEGCGARGTVGRAGRGDAMNAEIEEHRFCADCWPEWSAFYRARWQEQARRAGAARRDRPHDARAMTPPTASGMWFESATWHGVIDFVRTMSLQARYYRDPPNPEALARFAADIRAQAPHKVGPMPIEVGAFLAEFGRDDPSGHAS